MKCLQSCSTRCGSRTVAEQWPAFPSFAMLPLLSASLPSFREQLCPLPPKDLVFILHFTCWDTPEGHRNPWRLYFHSKNVTATLGQTKGPCSPTSCLKTVTSSKYFRGCVMAQEYHKTSPYQLSASCGLRLPVPEIVSFCLIALDELLFHEFV